MTHHPMLGRIAFACANLLLLLNAAELGAQTEPRPLGSHSGGVAVARFSPDGQLVVTGSFDRTLQIHSVADGKLLRTLSGHTGQVLSLAITPDGRRIFSGARDNTINVWDMTIPTPVSQLAGHVGAVHAVVVSHDDAWIATGSSDHALKLFARADGKQLFELAGHAAAIERIAVKPDNAQIASGDALGIVRMWNPADGSAAATLGVHPGAIVGLAYHPTANTLMTAGNDGTVKLWSLPIVAPRSLATSADAVTAAATNTDGSLVVVGAADATMRIVNVATGEVRNLEGQSGAVTAVALSSDAALTASGSTTGEIRVWNVADGAATGAMLGHAGEVRAVSISPQKTHLASAGDDGTVRLWRMPVPPVALAGHTLPIKTLTVSSDGKAIVTGAADKTVRIFNPADGALVQMLAGHVEAVTAAAISPDSMQFATADGKGEVRLWSMADGAAQGTLLAHSSSIESISYSPDGKRLFTAGADGVWKSWQLPAASPQVLLTATAAATKLAFSSDGKQLVVAAADGKLSIVDPAAVVPPRELIGQVGEPTAIAIAGGLVGSASGEGRIRLWSAADGAVRPELLGHVGAVRDIDISPKGDLVASAGADGTLRLWKPPVEPKLLAGGGVAVDVVAWSNDRALVALGGNAGGAPTIVVRNAATGAVVGTMLGHEGAITALALSADKTKLISGSADKTARVWNLADPKFPEIAKFTGHAGTITAVAFSPDGTQGLSASADNTLKQWATADAVEIRALTGHTQPSNALAVVGATVVSTSADGTVCRWNLADGAAVGNFPAGAPGTCLAASVDGKLVAVGLANNTIKLLSAIDGKTIATLSGLTAAPNCVAFNADDQRIVGVSTDGVRVWNLGGLLLEQFAFAATTIKSAVLSADGAMLLAADAKNVLHGLTPSHSQLFAIKGEVTSVAFMPDAAALFVGAADGTVGQYSAADLKPMKSFASGTAAVVAVRVSADGKLLAVASADKAVRFWDLANATPAPAISPTKTLNLLESATAIEFNASGTRLATTTGDNFVQIRDVASLVELQRAVPHSAAVQSIALSPDGNTLYSASSDKTVVASQLNIVNAVSAADSKIGIADASLSADGKFLATAAGTVVKLWDTAVGTVSAEIAASEKPLASVALRSDALQLAAGGSDPHVFLWQLTPQGAGALTKIPVPAAVVCLRYDSAGKRLAVACADGHLRVLDAMDGRVLEDVPQAASSGALAFTADGQAIVCAAAENGYVQPLSLVRLLAGHEGATTGVAFSPDGTRLFSSGVDKSVRLWNVADGLPLGSFAGPAAAVTSMSLSSNGLMLAAACAEKSVHVWEVPAAPAAQPVAAKFSLMQSQDVLSVGFSSDGTRLATGDATGTVRVFDVATTRELERFAGHTGAATTVAIAGDGKSIVSGGVDKTVRLWPISAQQIFIADPAKLIDAAITPDGTQFVTAGSTDMSVKIWDAAGKQVRACAPATAALGKIAMRSDGMQVAGADAQGRLLLWNVADGSLTSTIETGGAVQRVAYSRDGKQIALAGATHLKVFDSATAALLQENISATPLLTSQFTNDEKDIVSGADRSASLWANASPVATASLSGHQGPVYSVTISRDGSLLASASGDQSIRIWNLATGEFVRQCTGHVGAVYSLHFNDDGSKLLSSGADGTARIWDAKTGTELNKVAPLPAEGERIAAAFDAALSPNGQFMAVAGDDAQLRTWNVANGQLASTIEGHVDAIYRVTYNKSGTRIVTCGYAGNLNVWDIASGKSAFAAKLPAVAYYASLAEEGNRVVVGCADGKAYIVELPEAVR